MYDPLEEVRAEKLREAVGEEEETKASTPESQHETLRRSSKLLAEDMREFFEEELALARRAREIVYERFTQPIREMTDFIANFEEHRLADLEKRMTALEAKLDEATRRAARAEAMVRILGGGEARDDAG